MEFKKGDRVKCVNVDRIGNRHEKYLGMIAIVLDFDISLNNDYVDVVFENGEKQCLLAYRFEKVKSKDLFDMIDDVFDKNIQEKTEVKKFVKCEVCGKEHYPNAKTFFSIAGNICVGKQGGIIGNNFDDEGKLNRVMVYCLECLSSAIDKTKVEVQSGKYGKI